MSHSQSDSGTLSKLFAQTSMRIRVAFEPPVSNQDKRLVVINDSATNNDLAKKVAALFHKDADSFTLELEGYILEGKELVCDSLRELETVTARAISTNSTPPVESHNNNPAVVINPTTEGSYLPQQLDYKAKSVPSDIQRSKRVWPYTHTTLQSPPEITESAGDAQRPTKRIRIQEPNTPPTSTQSSETKSSPKRLPRQQFAPEMNSALLPFKRYLKSLATGQLDIYFESIQPEGITDLGVTLPTGPMLLLHSLGESPDDERLPNLFRNDTVHLFAVSGSGKTRLSLEGLCHKWGLYISCGGTANFRLTGSGDFYAVMDIMEDMSNWKESTDKVDLAHRAFAMLICARVFVLKCLLDLLPADTSAESARRRWVLAQVMPPTWFDKDIFVVVLNSLRAAYKTDLVAFTDSVLDELALHHSQVFYPRKLFAVVDEAQLAAEYLNESFRSVNSASEKRPVLHPLYNFLWHSNFFRGVILAGTGLSMKMVRTAVISCYVRTHPFRLVPFVFVEVGRFKKDNTSHKTYIEKYLSLSESDSDQRLKQRILYWFHGRYRFTATLIEFLLSVQSVSQHRIFTAFVHSLTGFTLTDAIDLEEKEPTIAADIIDRMRYQGQVANLDKSGVDLLKYVFHAVMRWRIGSESTYMRIDADMQQTIAAGIGHLTMVGPNQTFDMETNYPVYLCEPLVVLYLSSILSKRLDTTVEAWIADKARLASDDLARGPVLEEAIFLVLLTMFGGKELTLGEVFDTDQPWGLRKVTLVSLKRGFDNQMQCYPVSWDSGTSDRLGYKAASPEDVLMFLNNPNGKCVLFPDNHMGPDVACFFQDVETKELILLVLQSELSKKLKSETCMEALASVNPDFFYNVKKKDGDRVDYAPSKYPGLIDDVWAVLEPLVGAAEYKPLVEDARKRLCSSTIADQEFANKPTRLTPRFLRIIATRDETQLALFKAANPNGGVLKWCHVNRLFGDVVWDSAPSVA